MVRFSCFNAHIHSPKPKKTVQLSAEAMQKALEDCSKSQAVKDFTNSTGTSSLYLKVQGGTLNNGADHFTSSSSVERACKSEEFKSKYNIENDNGVHNTRHIRKCLSFGSGLDWKGRVSGGNGSEDQTDQGLSCDGSYNQIGLVGLIRGKDLEISLPDPYHEALPFDSVHVSSDMLNNKSIFSIGDPLQSEKDGCENSDTQFSSVECVCQEALPSDSLQVSSDMVNYESNFSIGDPQLLEKEGHENSNTQFSGECAGEYCNHSPCTPPAIVKSRSLPNIGTCGENSTSAYLVRSSRSSEDLNVLDSRRKEMLVHEIGTLLIQEQERDESVWNNEKNNGENPADDGYDTYNYVGSAKDWIMPVMDELNTVQNLKGESSARRWEELPRKDFKIQRIEEWVMDLQHCTPLEELNDELATTNDHQIRSGDTVLDGLAAARPDGKVTPGMEAAKKYISSLSATATTAQLANNGLAVIPFLSAFVSLRALNLSGNAIVRITAGALPRGLHILNLSKNNISTIEGLRELTRLRVLDLSYNRIFRIGHGLASCSSLKELYLAGNKISEVEGLHRLLKLNVLDLRFNKISTTKCLGLLAANYNSLQAISLEGNPAQKNVGDEPLKKYLQGLLPHLAYFNRQPIKAGTLKDAADRSVRLGIAAHQSDRGLRSELKTMRKGNHVAAQKVSSSSIHGRRSQAVAPPPKPSRGRQGRLPPSGTKTTTNRHHFYDFGSKLLSFRPDLSIRRSRSEGTLGVL